ncbi:MAG: hypothetical protein ACT4TC_18980, partial [Myxococcaceae bacterium]
MRSLVFAVVLSGCAMSSSAQQPSRLEETYRCQVRMILPEGTPQELETELTRSVSSKEILEQVKVLKLISAPRFDGYVLTLKPDGRGEMMWPDAHDAVRGETTLTGPVGGWTQTRFKTTSFSRESKVMSDRLAIETTRVVNGGILRIIEDCIPNALV